LHFLQTAASALNEICLWFQKGNAADLADVVSITPLRVTATTPLWLYDSTVRLCYDFTVNTCRARTFRQH